MILSFDAVYEGGVLRPEAPLPLREHQRVRATLESDSQSADGSTGWRVLIPCQDAALIEQAALDPDLNY